MLTAFVSCLASIWLAVCGPGAPPPNAGASTALPEAVGDTPFDRYRTTDSVGREITYYVSRAAATDPALPLALYVQGSGSQSIFVKRNERIHAGFGAGPIERALRGKARLVLVEKPGLRFLDSAPAPGTPAPDDFRREHTLDRWSAAISAALDAALTLPGVDGSRTLVLGHSEGGLVACRVAAINSRITHVACLAGGGPTQLFDLIELARRGVFYGHISDQPEERVAALVRDWRAVLDDPESSEKHFLGHPHRRWSSFLATSPMEELLKTDAAVFLAQGDADEAVTVTSFDALYATLLARGRDVTARRLAGADHSFAARDEAPGQGWTSVMNAVAEWFAGRAHETP
jgi:dienelactone hydrolase